MFSNPNSGTGAYAMIEARNGATNTSGMRLGAMGTAYSGANEAFSADTGILSASSLLSGGMSIMARAGEARIYTGGVAAANRRVTFESDGDIEFGNGGVGDFFWDDSASTLALGGGGTAATEALVVTNNQNAGTRAVVVNSNAGTGAFSMISVRNGSTSAEATRMGTFGTAWTTTGGYVQDWGLIETGGNLGGLVIQAKAASGEIQFRTGGTTENVTIESDGDLWVAGLAAAVGASNVCWDGSGATLIGQCTSLGRFKRDQRPITGALELVGKLRPTYFRWVEGVGDGGEREQLGLIAEEVETAVPQMAEYEDDGSLTGVNYDEGIALLVAAMQEQQAQIEALQERIKELEK